MRDGQRQRGVRRDVRQRRRADGWHAAVGPRPAPRPGGHPPLHRHPVGGHPAPGPDRPDARHVRRRLREADDRQPAPDEEARPPSRASALRELSAAGAAGELSRPGDRLRRPGRRLGLRRLRHRAAADREGLPGGRARGGRAVRRRRLRGDVVRHQAVPVPAGDRLLRHPAHRPPQGLPDPVGRRGRRRVAGLRQHALRAVARLLRRPGLARHHRLARRAGAVLRPGQADAGGHAQPAAHAGRRGDARGGGADGRGGDVRADAGRRLLRRAGGGAVRRRTGPLLRRRGARSQPVPQLRRVHDRLPPQRQEHPGEELPAPRREERRPGAAADDRHAGLATRRAAGTTSTSATPRPRSAGVRPPGC